MNARTPFFLLLLVLPLSAGAAPVVLQSPLYVEYDVQPGKAYEGTLEIVNPNDTPQDVKLYQTDYLFWADGRNEYGEPGKVARSNARWITVAPARATIPPNETLRARYTVQVPNDASLKGAYWSMIMVEPVDPSSPESSSGGKEIQLGVRQVLRYAVQVATTIGSTGTVKLKFAGMRLAAEGGKRNLQVDVENTGERTYRATTWVDLYDAKGGYVGQYQGGDRRLYPGTSVRFSIDLAGVADATYKALVLVDCGGDNVFGANVNLVLKP